MLLLKNENGSPGRAHKAEDENNMVLLEMKVIILEIYEVSLCGESPNFPSGIGRLLLNWNHFPIPQHIHEVILDYRLTNLLTCLKQESTKNVGKEKERSNLAELDLQTFTEYFEESVRIW